MTGHESDRELEKFVDRVLRDQPLRRAPAELANRVLAQLGQRAAKPWWQTSFHAWPVPARVLFMIASIAICAFALEMSASLLDALDTKVLMSLSRGIALWQAANTAAESLAKVIPMHWIYVAGAVIAALYASFFALGAAAYRTLYQNR